jgi:4-amino-4-deoxy-L-arabinose transferase-like glycosyltransferase
MAWMVIPAFALVYLVAAPLVLRRRLVNLGLAALVTVLVSLSWTIAVALTPAGQRPFVDATTSNSPIAMVFGYNALARFGFFAHLTGALIPSFGPLAPEATSPTKLISATMASQVGWLYPLAIVALVAGLVWRRGAPRSDKLRAGFLLWAVWLGVSAVAFSAGVVLHTAYMAALAVPVAALAGVGIVQLAEAFKAGDGRAWLLPATAVLTIAWTVYLSSQFPGFLTWLTPVVIGLGAIGVVAMAAARVTGTTSGRLALAGVAVGVFAMVATPIAWAASTLDPRYDGTVIDATAGPLPGVGLQSKQVAAAIHTVLKLDGGSDTEFGAGPLNPQQASLLAYLQAHRGNDPYLFAAQDEALATLYIIKSGDPVLTMGGFSGAVPFPTADQFQRMVADRQVRYVLLGVNLPRPPGSPETTSNQIGTWVRGNCRLVPAAAYGGVAPTPANPFVDTLYLCG